MSSWRAPVTAYERQAEALFAALAADEENAAWSFKWMHPRFRGKGVEDVKAAELDAGAARLVVAQTSQPSSRFNLSTRSAGGENT